MNISVLRTVFFHSGCWFSDFLFEICILLAVSGWNRILRSRIGNLGPKTQNLLLIILEEEHEHIICAHIYKSYAHRIPFAYASQLHCVYIYIYMQIICECLLFAHDLYIRCVYDIQIICNFIGFVYNLHMQCVDISIYIQMICK